MSEQRYIIRGLLGRWFLRPGEGCTPNSDEAYRFTADQLVKNWTHWNFRYKPVVRVVWS